MNLRRSEADKQFLEQLYRDHGDALRSFLLGRVRSKTDIDDIVQEVFTRLARKEDLEGRQKVDSRQNRAYLFTAANNLIVDMERRKAIRREYCAAKSNDLAGTVYELSPEVEVVAQEQLSTVKAAITALKPTWRTAFILSRFKHMNYKEISVVMSVTERQVEAFVARAVAKLKKTLEAVNKGQEQGGSRR
ncbi:RNA polymerase sigma factor [Porticoccaceae bacterium LTM1]|nr:RNA polymerase sigma factor [Porticoccaceae bacterium LTM1]